jgi:hypothetical protein
MSFNLNDPAIQELIAQMVAQQVAQQMAAQQQQQHQQPNQVSNPTSSSFSPCPKASDITLLQATFIDNGAERKKNTSRHKMCLEMWTTPAQQISLYNPDWKRNVILIDFYAFSRRMDNWKAQGAISEAYFNDLGAVWRQSNPNHMFGLLGDKGDPKGDGPKGTTYYDQQFMRVEMRNGEPIDMALFLVDDLIQATKFVTTDLKGNPLKGIYTHQSRLNRCGYYENWGTE